MYHDPYLSVIFEIGKWHFQILECYSS